MRVKHSPQKLVTIFSISVALSLLTVVFGAPLMRVLRMTYGAIAYWLLGLLVTIGFWLIDMPAPSVFVGSVWMTLGAYMELERRGLRWAAAAPLGVSAGVLFFVGTAALSLMNAGVYNLAGAEVLVKQFVDKLYKVNPSMQIEASLLVQLIPSAVVTVLIVALGVGLIFERRAFSWLKLPRENVASQLNLLEFRLPDFIIWVAMTAFLLTMENFNVKALEILGLNIVNVVTALYFFQGLAIMEVGFRTFRASALLRAAVYIILVGQLFPVVSAIGLIDYWVDFRKRFRKMRLASKSN
ncbi:MAG: DUF2232 domain-containing protein [Bdellovibrionaceae bacterium]|nr:DUF2232 domain-containing protein [Pseudobdellovibrionaceae bacterium]